MGPQVVHDEPHTAAGTPDDIGTSGLALPEQALLDSVVAISSNLDVRTVLSRILASACDVTGAEFGELRITGPGRAVLEVVSDPDSRPRAELAADACFLDAPVRVRGTVVGTIELARRAPFTAQERALVEGLGHAAGFAIDNARSHDDSERRRQWLEASAWLSEALRPPIDLDVALRRITAVARSISGAAATAFVQWPQGSPPVAIRADDVPREALDDLLLTLGQRTDQPSELKNVLRVGLGDRTAVVLPLRSHVAVPTALVAVFDERDRLPGPEETALLESLADHAALALDRVQAVADRADLAAVSQRESVARALHDVVMQRLFATGLQLQGMRATVDNPDTLKRIDGAMEGLDATIRDIRRIIFDPDRSGPATA